MTNDEQARIWKDPDSRDESNEDHPAGRLELSPAVRTGIRSALLGGAMVAAAVAGLGDCLVPPSISISFT